MGARAGSCCLASTRGDWNIFDSRENPFGALGKLSEPVEVPNFGWQRAQFVVGQIQPLEILKEGDGGWDAEEWVVIEVESSEVLQPPQGRREVLDRAGDLELGPGCCFPSSHLRHQKYVAVQCPFGWTPYPVWHWNSTKRSFTSPRLILLAQKMTITSSWLRMWWLRLLSRRSSPLPTSITSLIHTDFDRFGEVFQRRFTGLRWCWLPTDITSPPGQLSQEFVSVLSLAPVELQLDCLLILQHLHYLNIRTGLTTTITCPLPTSL